MFENGFVLLANQQFSAKQFINELQHDWQLVASDIDVKNNILSFSLNGFHCTLSVMPARVPNNEAEHYAKATYLCPDSVAIAKAHQAHLMITVINLNGADLSLIACMTVYSKIIATCLKQESATGVYTSKCVFSAEFYIEKCMTYFSTNEIPIMLWVYIGFARSEQGNQVYTVGMEKFQKHEMEILNNQDDMASLVGILSGMCSHIVRTNLTMNDGETFGFSEEQKWSIHLSKSVYAPTDSSLKLQVQDLESVYQQASIQESTNVYHAQDPNISNTNETENQQSQTDLNSERIFNPYLVLPLIPIVTVLIFFLSLKGDYSSDNVFSTIRIYFIIAHLWIIPTLKENNWKNLLIGLFVPFAPLWFFKNSLLQMNKTQNIWSNINTLIALMLFFIHSVAFLGLIGFSVLLKSYSLPILLTWLASGVFSYGYILYQMSKTGLAWLLFGIFVPVLSQLIFYSRNKENPNSFKGLILYFIGIVTFVVCYFVYKATL